MDLSISEAIQKLQNLPRLVGELGVEIMKSEVPKRSGELEESIFYEAGVNEVFIGTEKFYATYVENGRGPVRPVNKKVLHWDDDLFGSVFTKYARATKPNDFVGRTAKKLPGAISQL